MSKFHEGERAVQSRSGVMDEAGRLGRGITSAIPDAARPFLESQRLAVMAGVDRSGRVWASMVSSIQLSPRTREGALVPLRSAVSSAQI